MAYVNWSLFGIVLLISTVTGSPRNKNNKGSQCLQRQQVEQDNLKLVTAFVQEAFGQHDLSAVDKYISCDYIEHDPIAPNGRQGVKDTILDYIVNGIKKAPVGIRRSAASGDLVWLHSRSRAFDKEPIAIVDIFRVKDGKIVEHWDVIEVIPPRNESLNSNPMV